MTDQLLEAIGSRFTSQDTATFRLGNLLMLQPPRAKSIPALHTWFNRVVGETRPFKMLPWDQLWEVLGAPADESRDVFIWGSIDMKTGLLTLVRGNLEQITVPTSIFRPSGTSRPNFDKFGLDDYGHAIRFGVYEASADYVLYEASPDYRRRINAKRRKEERGLGPSLRRLRIQRGIAQNGFPSVPAKTISRIERGEVEKPHARTLRIISETLGVPAEEFELY